MRTVASCFQLTLVALVFFLLLSGCRAPWKPAPEKVVRAAAVEMSRLKSARLQALSLSIEGQFPDPRQLFLHSLTTTGAGAAEEEKGTLRWGSRGNFETLFAHEQPKSDLTHELRLTLGEESYPLTVQAKTLGNDLFINFQELPNLSKFFDLSALKGTFWRLPRTSLRGGNLQNSLLDKKEKIQTQARNLSLDGRLALAKRLASLRLFTVTSAVGAGLCPDGAKAYHYQGHLNGKDIEMLYREYLTLSSDVVSAQRAYATNQFFAQVSTLPTELWIAQKTSFLCRVEFRGDYHAPLSQAEYHVVGALELSDFNADFLAQAPEDAQALTLPALFQMLSLKNPTQ